MRLKILCGLLALIFSSAGMLLVVTDVPGEIVPPSAPDNMQSTLMEIPVDGDINTLTAQENLYIASGELQRSGSFRGKSEGVTVSMGVNQAISATRTVKDDSVFKQSVSFSTFVKLGEQRYVRGTNDYIVRPSQKVNALDNVQWADTATPISQANYNELYGYIPTGLTGYILNDSTILSAELSSQQDGLYTFHYVLDHTTAPYYVLYEMRTSAGTKAFPEFIRAELYVTMNSNWQVQSVSTDCEYKVAMLGGTLCKENLTETFYDIGKVDEVDNTDFFSQYFGKEAEEITDKVDPLTEIMNIFQPYISEGEPLNAQLSVAQNGSAKPLLTGKVNLLLDIENLDNIVANVKLDGIADIAYKQGKLYIAKDKFKGSMTVDGIMSAVGKITQLAGLGSLDLGGSIDLDSLLAGLKVDKGDTYCNLTLDTNLMGIDLDATIKSTINQDGTYTLNSVVANVAGFAINVTPCGSWQVLDTSGEFYDLLGILDIIQDGVVAFDVNLLDKYNLHVQYDIANSQLNAQLGDLLVALQDNNIYLTLGQLKLKLALSDINKLADTVSAMLQSTGLLEQGGLDLSALGLDSLDLDSILQALYFNSTQTSAQLGADLGKISLALNLKVVNDKWTFDSLNGALGEYSLSATPTKPRTYSRVDDSQYIDVANLVEAFIPYIENLLKAESLEVNLNASLVIDGVTYKLQGELILSNGLQVDAQLYYGSLKVLDADIIMLDGKLFVKANNIKLALNLPTNSSFSTDTTIQSILDTLKGIKGYNDHLDSVVDFVINLLDGFSANNIDYAQLIKNLNYDGQKLECVLDGKVLGSGDLTLQLGIVNNGLQLAIKEWQVGNVSVALDGTVIAGHNRTIAVNESDYQLNLVIKLDEVNTIYANIDTLNGIFRFKMGDMYAEYSNNEIKVNYNDIAIKGDINQLTLIIDKLSELANNRLIQSGSNVSGGLDINSLLNIDIKDILNSIKLTQTGDNLYLSLQLAGYDASVELRGGQYPTINNITLAILGKNIVVNTEDFARDYVDFGSLQNVVAIEDIFDDYYPVLEDLVMADGWHFDLNAELTIGADKYQLAQGSTFDFLYINDNDFHLKANLIVKKYNGTEYADFMNIKAIYLNERVYIEYNGLKLTISKEALIETFALKDQLFEVIPQLGDLINSLLDAMNEAEGNSQTMDYSKLLTQASYKDGVFTLGIDGGVLIDKLGVITLAISRTESGTLQLNIADFVYDNITVHSFNVGVVGNTREQCLANIGEVTTDGYYNLDSLYELLSAVITTADNNTFRIEGTVKANALFIPANIGIDLYVDIDNNGKVFIALQISREYTAGVYNDKGGNSYLYYNGESDMITVIRDSYVGGFFGLGTKLEKNNFYAQVTSQEFMSNFVYYLMEIINFSDIIRNPIENAINSDEPGNSFEIVDVWKGYSYTADENGGKFTIKTDLSPIDSALGEIDIHIGHDSLYNLTSLNGDGDLVGGIVGINFVLNHTTPTYGIAVGYVDTLEHWKGIHTV